MKNANFIKKINKDFRRNIFYEFQCEHYTVEIRCFQLGRVISFDKLK
jgi:hypothetical protein